MAFAANVGSTYQYGNNIIIYNANSVVNTNYFFTFLPQSANGLTLANGMIWSSNVYNGLKTYQAGASSTITGCIFVANTEAQCNTTAETPIIPAGIGTTTLPANFLTPGKTIRVVLFAFLNLVSGAAGTISCSGYLGTTKVANGQPTGTINGPSANTIIRIENYITCISTGNTGQIRSSIIYSGQQISTSGIAANSTGVTLNTTVPLVVNVTATMTMGSNTRLISIDQGFIEVVG